MADGRHIENRKSAISQEREIWYDENTMQKTYSNIQLYIHWDCMHVYIQIRQTQIKITENSKDRMRLSMRKLVCVKSAIHRVGKIKLYATLSTLPISANKTTQI